MILTTRLKIWTLISHACILIGLGHGVLTLGIAEVFWLTTFFTPTHSSSGDGDVSQFILQLVSILCLVGQVATLLSIFIKQYSLGKWLHIGSLGLLWASVVVYGYGIRNDHYAHLAVLSCLPFAYCTIRTLLGAHLQLLWQRIGARI